MDLIGPIILLKLRLTFRRARGGWQIVMTLLMLFCFIVPVGLGGAVFSHLGFERVPGADRRELLHLILGGMWLFWLIFPVIGFSLNQSYDLTKLFIYPIRRPALFFANVLACFADPTLLILLPALSVIAYHYSPKLLAGGITGLALLLFMLHTIALSQALLWALMNILQSRRIRDLAIILGPLLGVILYLMPQLMMNRPQGDDPYAALLGWGPSRVFALTPPGIVAEAIAAAGHGKYAVAALYLGGCFLQVVLVIALGSWVLGKLHAGEIGSGQTKSQQEKGPGQAPLLQRIAASPLGAMALKEARYYWRDPRHKIMLIAPLFPLAWVYVMSRYHMTDSFMTPISAPIFVASMVLMSFSQLFQNIFGIDREGLRLLFVTPCSRAHILMGKNIAAILVAATTTSAATLITGIAFKRTDVGLAMIPVIWASAIILAGVGNIMSVYFPMRMTRKGENPFTSSSSKGCMAGLASMAALAVMGIVASPIAAGVGLALWFHEAWIFAAVIPASFAYALGIYALLLRKVSSPALMARETNILEECLTGEPS